MAKPGSPWSDTLLWTYSRGTWQYDLICAVILAFIFFVPPALLRGKAPRPKADATLPQLQQAAPLDAGQAVRETGKSPQQDRR